MRFSSVFGALSALALVAADGAAIFNAMTAVSDATVKLDNTVAKFNGNPLQVLPITVQSSDLLKKIKAATKVAQDSAPLAPIEAITIGGATQSLTTVVLSALTTIRSKKPTFDKLIIVSPIVLLNLKQEKAATSDFSAAVVAKVPAELQEFAKTLTQPILDAFDETIALYKQFSIKERDEASYEEMVKVAKMFVA